MARRHRAQRRQEDGLDAPHALGVDETLERLGVDPRRGLSADEVRRRRRLYGENQLPEAQSRSAATIFVAQFKSAVILVLVAALAAAAAFAKWPEAIAIAAVVVVNAGIGFFTEFRAVRSMEALRQLGKNRVRVRRAGEAVEVPASEIVPGDILLLERNALVPADARLISERGCRANEAALTGESVPSMKSSAPVDEQAPLAERSSMLLNGTTVVEADVEAVVVATGVDTELGRISELAQQAESASTPLQRRLDRLGRRLALVVLLVVALVAGAGLAAGRDTLLMIEAAIALGVAAIPEGLPIVATIALARGMWLMAQRHALINRLPAVETLGATRIICTDKTGTLTENRMTVRRIVTSLGDHEARLKNGAGAERPSLENDPAAERLIDVGVLCNNAGLPAEDEEETPGADPTEVALLQAGDAFGRRRRDLLEQTPEVREVQFDPDVMMMATFHRTDDGFRVAVKGAPQAVLQACDREARDGGSAAGRGARDETLSDESRGRWRERAEALAAEGLRVLAFAEKTTDSEEAEPYEDLRLLGLIGLLDPPREGVREAIDTCQRAGVHAVMVTGDQPATAKAIAEAVGMIGDPDDPEARVMHGRELEDLDQAEESAREAALRCNIFARVSPEQKLNLVRAYQAAGETVAMTGDGVNDAPALRKADIGIAMGRRGTDAAKQVADMILTDDAFATIVAAIEQGRVIFGNIRNAALFMLCTNVAEVLAVAIASVAQTPLPLRPLQILYLNVLTDVFPALALAMTAGSPGVMERPPRAPHEAVLTRRHWLAVGGWGGLIAACVLASLYIALTGLGLTEPAAVTVSFLTLGFSKLWFVFNLRDWRIAMLASPIVRNPWIWGAIGFCAILLGAAVYAPGLSDLLETRSPGLAGWGAILGFSLVTVLIGQAYLVIRRRMES